MSGKTATAGRVDLDKTRERLEKLGLLHASEQLPALLTETVKNDRPHHRFLDELLEVELSQREERRIKTSLRLSGLPPGQTLGNFDFSFQPSVEKSRIETLATCGWIREHETVLLQGPPGWARHTWLWAWASRRSRMGSPSRSSSLRTCCRS